MTDKFANVSTVVSSDKILLGFTSDEPLYTAADIISYLNDHNYTAMYLVMDTSAFGNDSTQNI